MSQMILEYDEFCMFLLNIEVFNIMTPDFPYTSENETKCTILYFCMFYFHLFNVLLKKVKNVDIFLEILYENDTKRRIQLCVKNVIPICSIFQHVLLSIFRYSD
jgi:hypothetical protein